MGQISHLKVKLPRFGKKKNLLGLLLMSFAFFSDFRKHYSIAIRTSSSKQALDLHMSKSRQSEQVVCNDGAALTSHESVPPRPGGPKQSESSFEHGDVGFDTCPKVPEFFVNPGAFHHLQDCATQNLFGRHARPSVIGLPQSYQIMIDRVEHLRSLIDDKRNGRQFLADFGCGQGMKNGELGASFLVDFRCSRKGFSPYKSKR